MTGWADRVGGVDAVAHGGVLVRQPRDVVVGALGPGGRRPTAAGERGTQAPR